MRLPPALLLSACGSMKWTIAPAKGIGMHSDEPYTPRLIAP